MGDMLQSGLGWLKDQLQEHVSRSVTYHRGNDQVSVQATLGRSLLKLDDGYGGIRMEWTDRDFLIPASALILGSTATIPERGDRIHELNETSTSMFEVMAYGGEPPWRYCDPHQHMLRIHTKFIGFQSP